MSVTSNKEPNIYETTLETEVIVHHKKDTEVETQRNRNVPAKMFPWPVGSGYAGLELIHVDVTGIK